LQECGELGKQIRDAEDRGDRDEIDRLPREWSAPVSLFPIVEHAFGESGDRGSFALRR